MKTMMLLGVMISLAQASPVLAAVPALPLLGSWALDLEHSQIPAEARPKSVIITYKDVGGGKWSTDVAIVGSNEARINATGTYPLVALDGKTMSETIVWLNINGKPEITTKPVQSRSLRSLRISRTGRRRPCRRRCTS